jgi:hypothetical protein
MVIDYSALQSAEFVDLSGFDVFSVIIKKGLNAAGFVCHQAVNLIWVLPSSLNLSDFELQG